MSRDEKGILVLQPGSGKLTYVSNQLRGLDIVQSNKQLTVLILDETGYLPLSRIKPEYNSRAESILIQYAMGADRAKNAKTWPRFSPTAGPSWERSVLLSQPCPHCLLNRNTINSGIAIGID